MIINKIFIDNIKGIDHFEFSQDLYPNRPNILVAPNGYGKSSFATAFLSAQNGPIVLKPEECHNEDINNNPKLEVSLKNGQTLVADKNTNTIINEYNIYVANNQLIPNAKAKHFGQRTHAKADLDIKPTHIIRKVPKPEYFAYHLPAMKRKFGVNNKILKDISNIYTNAQNLAQIEKGITFHTFDLKPYNKAIIKAIAQINSISIKVSAVKIKDEIERKGIMNLDIPDWNAIVSNIKTVLECGDADAALSAWQYLEVRRLMGYKYNKALEYANFLFKKSNIDRTLDSLNPVQDRFSIFSKVEGSDLVIRWPKAHQISNGQRDIMVFIAQLIECEFQSGKNCILVIDEFFDYLDDANLVAFQYYVSNLIDKFKRNKRLIFPILLTHIDPKYLKHFCFNDKRLNVCYLKETKAKIGKEMVKLVAKREDPLIKLETDTFFFHYHPNSAGIDISNKFANLGLNKDWGKPIAFRNKVDRQTRAMFYEPDKPFDPLAVCFSIRIKIEETIYSQLKNDADRDAFLKTHGTKEKLYFAQSKGVFVPETYHLLGIIYNHPLHDADENMACSLSMKLDNPVIKNMILKLW